MSLDELGNPENAEVWSKGGVFVSFEESPAVPVDINADFGADWDYVGVLSGTAGISESATQTVTKHTGWGHGTIAETEKDHDVTISFTAREWNDTVKRLAYPASTEEGVLKYGPAEGCWVAYELNAGTKVKRFISRRPCQVRRNGDTVRNEDGLEETPFEVTILPDEDGHWTLQETETGS